jgi:hypothetical protein
VDPISSNTDASAVDAFRLVSPPARGTKEPLLFRYLTSKTFQQQQQQQQQTTKTALTQKQWRRHLLSQPQNWRNFDQ